VVTITEKLLNSNFVTNVPLLLLLLSPSSSPSSLLMLHPFEDPKPGNISTTLAIQCYNMSPLSFRRVA